MTRSTLAPPHTSTLFLSAEVVAGIVRQLGVAHCLEGIAECIRQDFLRWPAFAKTSRVASHSPGGVIELMPIADDTSYSFKYVNGHPRNARSGLPTVMAFGVLADVETGLPRMLSELTLATALRTAAMSALAARVLARPESRSMAMIGNGAQSEFQALAFQRLLGIQELRAYDIDAHATARLQRNLRASGLRIVACSGIAEAVRGADIVTTVTADKTRATILTPAMVEPGMHINAVGGDSPSKTELHAQVLRQASVFVEYTPQTRLEGEIQQLPAHFPVTELWEVLAGRQPGRRSSGEVTVFDSVGFALEDFSALRFLRDAAAMLGRGERIGLVPQLADPKDLFGTIAVQEPAGVEEPAGVPA